MNFWTFLDRNMPAIGWALFWAALGVACIFHESGNGCHLRIGSDGASVTRPDAGTP